MVQAKGARIMALVMIFSMIFAPLAHAEVQPPVVTDGPADVAATRAPAASPRLIVELDSPPLAIAIEDQVQSAAVNGVLDANSAAAQAYINQLQAEQAAFVSAMQTAIPSANVSSFRNEGGATEPATYQVVFNGLSIEPGIDREVARTQLARLPGVKAVYLDQPYSTQLYTSTTLINAPAIWNDPLVNGRANGGAGVKLASMDGGVHKDAPMMNGSTYGYPPGYGPNGLGLTANNNGKIIVSRAYFRPWDPPAPGDENPWPGEQGTSHGMHTSSTAAGNVVTATYNGLNVGTISGVAPRAYVMSYRVFYTSVNGNESFYTTEGLAALEDIVRDGADVVNNSWGGGPGSLGGEFDPIDQALRNAVKAGVFVAMSNGNAGAGLGTSDHPSSEYINVAASTTSGTLASGRVGVKDDPNLQNFPFSTASFGNPLPLGQNFDFPFVPGVVISPTNVLGCNPWPAGTFDGKAALIERGNCEFGVKVLNAQQAGAVFVVVYNSAAGGEGLINMGPGLVGDQVTIPSIFIGRTNGVALLDYYNTNGPAASILRFSTIAFQTGNTPDRIIAFSSRGPGVGNTLKPDIAAPGVNILAQGYTEGVTGEARHLGYGQASGTSMAAPHVAGAAALLQQVRPNWSPATIKSALMSTAKYTDVYNFDGSPAQPLDMGAGRLDLTHATDPGVILDPPSLSFGVVPSGTQKTLAVKVTSIASTAETYNVSTLYTGNGFTATTALPGFAVSAGSLTLNPGETKTISVTFTTTTSAGLSDNQGYIVMDGPVHDAHMAAWARVTNALNAADVLIIDADFSDVGPLVGFSTHNYLDYYTSALTGLGYSYEVLNYDLESIPDAATLSAYQAIILFTGDNALAAAGLQLLELDRLVEFLNQGGTVIAMGQNLAATLGAAQTDPSNPPFFYGTSLGANWIQNSVTGGTTPQLLVLPAPTAPQALQDIRVDLTRILRYAAAGELSGDQETPPVATDTTGEFDVHYDAVFNRLEYAVTVVPSDTRPITVTAAHIHVGAPGVAGPVIRPLGTITQPIFVTDSLTLSGVISPSLNMTEVNQMVNGLLYINVHTTDFPDGEVRGQIEPEALPNQPSMDEVDNEAHNGSESPVPGEETYASVPILHYPGPNNLADGTVGLAHRDQPSLERAGVTYNGRSIYTTFGLEGVSEGPNASLNVTPTTRIELLGTFLQWGLSEAGAVVISDTTGSEAGGLTTFSASLTPGSFISGTQIVTPTAVSYRWDFGDGSPIVGPLATSEAGHAYADCGTYTIRAEITDSFGNVAIGSQTVTVEEACGEALRTYPLFFPLIANSPQITGTVLLREVRDQVTQ